ncbi:hypothetical protein ACI2JA_03245 [Alkalihalobacillus sp. NPDC078783]
MKVSYDHNETLISINNEELMLLNNLFNYISLTENKEIDQDELILADVFSKKLQPAVDRLYDKAIENYNQEINYINGVYNK